MRIAYRDSESNYDSEKDRGVLVVNMHSMNANYINEDGITWYVMDYLTKAIIGMKEETDRLRLENIPERVKVSSGVVIGSLEELVSAVERLAKALKS